MSEQIRSLLQPGNTHKLNSNVTSGGVEIKLSGKIGDSLGDTEVDLCEVYCDITFSWKTFGWGKIKMLKLCFRNNLCPYELGIHVVS